MHDPEPYLILAAFEAVHGDRSELEIFGTDYPTPDGTCIRDYIQVNDLADAHVRGIEYVEQGSSTALNLGTGCDKSVHEVISTIERTGQLIAPPARG